jgi:transketolase
MMNNIEISTREASSRFLSHIGKKYDFLVVDADLSASTMTSEFKKEFPNRFFNVGCAEQNLIGVSAGLSLGGNVVFASSYSMFMMRAWEQIRNTIAHDELNVKIIATHSGLTNSADGSSHQCLEDIAIMRCIPNMCVLNPVDKLETELIIESEIKRKGCSYIRLNRIGTPKINNEEYIFRLGEPVPLTEGSDITIFATGTMVSEALKASETLDIDNIGARVVNVSSIKPLNKNNIIKLAKETGRVITIEEHNIYGGMGSAISEILSENYPIPMKIMGVKDRFGESGTYDHLIRKFGIHNTDIVKNVKEIMSVK